MSKVQTVELENGKYELRLHEESGALCAYRNGEPWQDFSGNKFVYLLMQEVLNLREAVRGLREVQAAPVALPPCDADVFERGESVCLQAVPKEHAEAACKIASALTGDKYDWHYIAGRVHVKRLATPPTTDAPAQAASGGEVVAHTSERHFALREAHGHRSEEDYFAARPNLDGPDERTTFRAGFARGFDAGEKVYATPASAPPAGDPPAPAAAREVVAPIIAARYRNSPSGRWTYTDQDIGSIEADGWREVTYLCDVNAALAAAKTL